MRLATVSALLLLHTIFHTHTHASTETNRAFIALDRIISGDLVESVNVTVTYKIHNVGTKEAKAVTLKDLSFPASRFTHFGEVPKQRWASLPASETLTHTLIVSPKRAGELIVSPASVSYLDDGDNKITRIATDDILSVEKLLDWRRRTDRHTKEWSMYMCAFALLCIAPFGVSLFMERGVPNGNKKKN